MPNFKYTARDERGNPVTGTLAAPNSDALADELRRMGYLVTQSRQVADASGAPGLGLGQRVGFDDMVMLNVQLAKLISVGIPLVTSLNTLAEQSTHPRMKAAVTDVARTVEGGASFSSALARHPDLFSTLMVNMVRAGEASGKLDDVLKRMSVFLKRQAELRQQVMTAMTYPAILFVVGSGVIGFLLTGIIPKFMKIFLEAGVALPLPTRILHEISVVVRAWWPAGLLAAAGAAAGLRAFRRSPAGRRTTDAWLMAVPVLGELVKQAAIARWARTLETLFSSGVPVLESLALAEETSGNAAMGDACRTVASSVRQGGALAEPLKASRLFPPMVIQMIAVGESSGTLDTMLAEIADHYDELVRHSLKRLTTLIEPVFLLVMGGLVALIMASVLLPLFRMVNVVR